ncbi:hypothetical protein T492DRAFT_105517 [Pavlovales sp. CCMP2436]|nr:hypothetical protein T492DRAFT_105517 [Pavlovales sp. CCMP2436]|mmetsp:Transcript_46998/g.109644  ORF Transcript_46998/g.109644 Transcript_46998/m.109644 type:complete len:429 (+) Transcript_46998:369-1655(+)
MTMREPPVGLSPPRAVEAQHAYEYDGLLLLLTKDGKILPEQATVVREEMMKRLETLLGPEAPLLPAGDFSMRRSSTSLFVTTFVTRSRRESDKSSGDETSAKSHRDLGRTRRASEESNDHGTSGRSWLKSLPAKDKEGGHTNKLSGGSSAANASLSAINRKFLSEMGYACLFLSTSFVTHLLADTQDLQVRRTGAFDTVRRALRMSTSEQQADEGTPRTFSNPGSFFTPGPSARWGRARKVVALTTTRSSHGTIVRSSHVSMRDSPPGSARTSLLRLTSSCASMISPGSPSLSSNTLVGTDRVVPYGTRGSRTAAPAEVAAVRDSWRARVVAGPLATLTRAPRELIEAIKVLDTFFCIFCVPGEVAVLLSDVKGVRKHLAHAEAGGSELEQLVKYLLKLARATFSSMPPSISLAESTHKSQSQPRRRR